MPSSRYINIFYQARARGVYAQLCLVLGTFFNPLGFDILFAFTTQLTGSYVITDVIFYGLALLFFGGYFLLTRKDKS